MDTDRHHHIFIISSKCDFRFLFRIDIKVVLNLLHRSNVLLKINGGMNFYLNRVRRCNALPYYLIKRNKMKRKTTLLLTVSLAIAATVFSQTNRFSGGIVAGANYSYLKTSDESTGITYNWKSKFGAGSGAY